jgi:hypothetical protein
MIIRGDALSILLSLTVITARKPPVLSKRFTLDECGALVKHPGGELTDGIADLWTGNFIDLANLLLKLSPGQALVYGISGHTKARVVSEKLLQKIGQSSGLPVISRTKVNLHWAESPGVKGLDYDPGQGGSFNRDEWLSIIYEVWPELKNSAHLWYPSASSCIYTTEGQELRGVVGQRLYIPVKQATDIQRAGGVLFKRLWLAGYGRFDISKSGALLERSVIDAAFWGAERLDFAGGAHCGPGLEQRRPSPEVLGDTGAFIDTQETLPGLSLSEENRLKELKAKMRRSLTGAVAVARKKWVDLRVNEEIKKAKPDDPEAKERKLREVYTKAVEGRVLMGDFKIQMADGSSVAVAEILQDPSKFDGVKIPDPLEPDYQGDTRIARLNLSSGGKPYIWSFAHGGVKYTLHRAPTSLLIEGGELHNIVDKALEVVRMDGTVFDRGGELIRLTIEGVAPVTTDWLLIHLNRLIRFERWDPKKEECKATDCTTRIAQSVSAMSGEWRLPKLKAILTAPVITPSGRIIDRDGYHPEEKIYLDFPDNAQWVPPTQGRIDDKTIQKAVDYIWHWFRLFPFKSAVDRGVFLAALLTAAVRPALRTAPGILIDSPVAGSGKTILAKCISRVAGMSIPALLPWDKSDEEMRKRLFAACRIGPAVLCVDNVEGQISSPALCAYTTSETMTDRVLGVSTIISVPVTSMFLITGNNVVLVGDLCRRFLRTTIDPQCEKPYRRAFPFDPEIMIAENRIPLINAVLSLLKAFLDAGAPQCSDRTASFEEWSDLVRSSVCWVRDKGFLDVEDPILAIDEGYEADPETAKLSALLTTWYQEFEKSAVTLPAVVDVAKPPSGTRGNEDLFAALDEIAGEKGHINKRRLGRWIERHAGRIVDGLRFVKDGERQNFARWRVEDTRNW